KRMPPGPRRHKIPGLRPGLNEPLVFQTPIGLQNSRNADPPLLREAAHRWNPISRPECPSRDQCFQFGRDLVVKQPGCSPLGNGVCMHGKESATGTLLPRSEQYSDSLDEI